MIDVRHLTREFRVPQPRGKGITSVLADLMSPMTDRITAINDVSFQVQRGDCVGYIGANGAGKTSTIKCLTGVIKPTAGTVDVNGFDPWKQRKAYTQNIGVVFGQKSLLIPDLPITDSFDYYRMIYRIPDQQYRQSRQECIEMLEIDRLMTRPPRGMSLGERMRCEIAAALLHDPPLLFLDEPTIGIDIVAKKRLHEFLNNKLNSRRLTIFLTTHQVDDINALCNRIMILKKGQLVVDQSMQDFRSRGLGDRSLLVKLDLPASDLAALAVSLHGQVEHDWLRLTLDQDLNALLNRLMHHGTLLDFRVEEQKLDSLIDTIYRTEQPLGPLPGVHPGRVA